jgi:prevent-host-death family protein
MINPMMMDDKPELVVTASDLSNHCAEVLTRVGFCGASFTVIRHGKPIAKLVPLKDLDDEEGGRDDPKPSA